MATRRRNPHRKTVCCVGCGRDTRDYLCLCKDCRSHGDPVDELTPKYRRYRNFWQGNGAGIAALHEWDEWLNRSPVGSLLLGDGTVERIVRLA